MVMLDLGRVR